MLQFVVGKFEFVKEDAEFENNQIDKLEGLPVTDDIGGQWEFVGSITDSDGYFKYKKLAAVMKAVMLITHSNADSKRIFSMVKKM